jgi:tripartite-type tricarboxylate transporter receptor subunit TctC
MSMIWEGPRITRRAALGAALAAPVAARAQVPDRPIRLVLGFPAGSAPDVVARLLADGMREAVPAGMVVENRPGAGGTLAAGEVARTAPADGSVLLFGEVGALAMAPSTYARLPYDPSRDFVAVAEVATVDFAFVVPSAVPANDLPAFLTWAHARPGGVFMGTPGAGTPSHFGASLLAAAGGLQMEPVHFRAQGEATTAILSGDVQGMFGTVSSVAPLVRASGGPRALLVTGPARSPLLPEVPTAAEAGHPSLAFEAWFGLVAPAATPAPVLATLEAAALRALAAPATRAQMEGAGFRIAAAGREAFAARMAAERVRWAEVVRATGFRAIGQ